MMSELEKNPTSSAGGETAPFSRTSQSPKPLLNPFSLLLECSQSASSGHLSITSGEVQWKITLENGQLQTAVLSIQSLEQLNYHLRYFGWKEAAEAIKAAQALNSTVSQEENLLVQGLQWLEKQGFLEREQVSQLRLRATREALEPLFWLSQGEYLWQEDSQQAAELPSTETLEIPSLLEEFRTRLTSWQALAGKVQSPHQRAYLFNRQGKQQPSSLLVKLAKLLRGLSLHQVATLIKQDDIKLTKMLFPYIESGEIFLREPKSPWDQLPNIPPLPQNPTAPPKEETTEAVKPIKIACVDDSPTILRKIQMLLGDEYEIIKINSPTEAASALFRAKPDLVLMDISMPEMNGYKLCSLLRNSKQLSQVPIIMVSSREGVIDKVRAKATGATDYLTKPFTKESLSAVIEKHLY
jgi:twitching motility two-component system response regulator PilG